MSGSRVYLRGVDLNSIVEKYLKGEFVTLTTPLPIDISGITQTSQPIISIKENVNDVSYQIDIGTGQTFGCIGYKIIDKDGLYGTFDQNKKYNCMYCLRKIKQNPLGIPIRREERASINGTTKIYYHMVDIFCTFNCCKIEIKRRSQNSIYSQSMVYLAEIYNRCTGKNFSELKCSPDQRFLKIFNGPMSYEEFHSGTVSYVEKPGNMYFQPVIELIEQTS
jgi:hypothetical protein